MEMGNPAFFLAVQVHEHPPSLSVFVMTMFLSVTSGLLP